MTVQEARIALAGMEPSNPFVLALSSITFKVKDIRQHRTAVMIELELDEETFAKKVSSFEIEELEADVECLQDDVSDLKAVIVGLLEIPEVAALNNKAVKAAKEAIK